MLSIKALQRVVLLLALFVGLANAQCANPKVRREWGQLSAAEKQGYADAVKALQQRPLSRQYSNPATISYYDFTST
ncbi:hypothetical protein HDU76_010581 [Blyttiomyces sp. JEL0837]|nr:hypothetical protein HDU76_010581 [Blyttiomyces sp. JEL0837]